MNVPFILDRFIEQRAIDFRTRATLLGVAKSFPFEVEHALELIHDFTVVYEADNLPAEAPGSIDFNKREVRISKYCFNDGHRLFTVAHEAGHVELHTEILKSHLSNPQDSLFGNAEPPAPLQHPRLEIQADLFASFLLVPTLEFYEHFGNQIQRGKVITPREVSGLFGVSLKTAEIRLQTINNISGGGAGQQAFL